MTAVFEAFVSPTGPVGWILERIMENPPELLADSRTATPTILFYCVWTGFGDEHPAVYGGDEPDSHLAARVGEAGRRGHGQGSGVHHPSPHLADHLDAAHLKLHFRLFGVRGLSCFWKGGRDEFTKTTTIGYWIFNMVYEYSSYNMVSATGLFFTCIGVPFILLVRWLVELIPRRRNTKPV